mmetsp:Transcript_66585/g.130942  ORF Transcript_66585/g.130942 Transcript_66585/m.130942 type:complete len:329 (-) Transcript_66585:234-1220(-)
MSNPTNKRKLNDEEEEQVLERIKAGDKYHSIASDYNISMTTVSKIKKGRPSKDEIDASRDLSDLEPPSVKKLAEYYPLMNKRMLQWVAQAQKRNVRISSAMLQERAKIVADSIGWHTFRASSGWCVKFLRRNNIKLRQLKRKAQLKSNCQEGTKWESRILAPRLNADGTIAESDSSDSDDMQDDDVSLDSDSENEDGLGPRSKPPTLEKARKAWNQLQEWFITHPPHQDRVMQAVFIINKEMMQPSFMVAPSTTPVPASTPSSSSAVAAPSAAAPSGLQTAAAEMLSHTETANAIAKLPKKRQQMTAALPVAAASTNFFQSMPSAPTR